MFDRRHVIAAGLKGVGILASVGALTGEPPRAEAHPSPRWRSSAASCSALRSDRWSDSLPAYRDIIIADCGIVVPEYEMKWGNIEAQPGIYDFGAVDRRLAFAQKNGMAFRGHTLVWHQALPDWLLATLDQGNARQLLTRHIAAVVGATGASCMPGTSSTSRWTLPVLVACA